MPSICGSAADCVIGYVHPLCRTCSVRVLCVHALYPACLCTVNTMSFFHNYKNARIVVLLQKLILEITDLNQIHDLFMI